MMTTAAALAAQGLAFWPVWLWYGQRLADPSSERWGIIALIAAALVILLQPPRATATDSTKALFGALAALLALYALLFLYAPMLLTATPALLSVLLVLRRWRPFPAAVYGLGLISLPVLPALDFYGGYPFRVITGWTSALMLQALGHPVVSEGVLLRCGNHLVMVDAPCSGLRMMWGGLLIAFALAGIFRHSWKRTVAAVSLAVFLTVSANIMRAVLLYFIETSQLPTPGWAHEGVGLVLFVQMALLLGWFCGRRIKEATP